MPNRGREDIDWSMVELEARKGAKLREMAADLKCSTATVWRNLARRKCPMQPKGRPVPEVDWADAKAAYEAGATLTALAKQYRRYASTMSKGLRRIGCVMRKVGRPRDTQNMRAEFSDWVEIYESDPEVTAQDIATAVGLSNQWVSWVLKRAGVKMRSKGSRGYSEGR